MSLRSDFQGTPECEASWAGDPAARPKWNCETNCCLSPRKNPFTDLGANLDRAYSEPLPDLKSLRRAPASPAVVSDEVPGKSPKTPSQGREEIAAIIADAQCSAVARNAIKPDAIEVAHYTDLILAALSAPSPEGVLKGKQGDRASVAGVDMTPPSGASDGPCKSEGGGS